MVVSKISSLFRSSFLWLFCLTTLSPLRAAASTSVVVVPPQQELLSALFHPQERAAFQALLDDNRDFSGLRALEEEGRCAGSAYFVRSAHPKNQLSFFLSRNCGRMGFEEAGLFCRGMGKDSVLPSLAQLTALIQGTRPQHTPLAEWRARGYRLFEDLFLDDFWSLSEFSSSRDFFSLENDAQYIFDRFHLRGSSPDSKHAVRCALAFPSHPTSP